MRTDWILAADVGTSSVKTALFRMDGSLVDSASCAHVTRHAAPGWADQNAEDWWDGFCRGVHVLVSRNPEVRQHLSVLGISGQMLGCLALSATGEPLYPSLIHADTRAAVQRDQIRSQVGAQILYDRTGNILDARSGLAKILWLKANEPEVYRNAVRFVQAKDFVVGRLTGNLDTTDLSDAAHAQWMDVNRRIYLDDIFHELSIDVGKLPALHVGTDVVGCLAAEPARLLGLPEGIPVVAGAGDGSCASAGAGSSLAGDFYACLGTTAWVSYSADLPSLDPGMRLFNLPSVDGKTCGVYGTTQSAGQSVAWIMKILGDPDEQTFDRAAEAIPPGSEGLLYLPYLEGERTPVFDTDARGMFFGLDAGHGNAHMRRAVLEGVAFALRDIIMVFRESMTLSSMRLIGGGAGSGLWRRIIASACGLPIERIQTPAGDATSLGIALAAAVGVGMHADLQTAQAALARLDVTQPDLAWQAKYETLFPIYAGLYKANKPLFEKLAQWRGTIGS